MDGTMHAAMMVRRRAVAKSTRRRHDAAVLRRIPARPHAVAGFRLHHVLPLARVPLVSAGACIAACGIRMALETSAPWGPALQQRGHRPGGGGWAAVATSPAAGAAPAGFLRAADRGSASRRAGAAALGTVIDHAGHGRLAE